MSVRYLSACTVVAAILTLGGCQPDRVAASAADPSRLVRADTLGAAANVYSGPDMVGYGGVEVDASAGDAYAYTSTWLSNAYVALAGTGVIARSATIPVGFTLGCSRTGDAQGALCYDADAFYAKCNEGEYTYMYATTVHGVAAPYIQYGTRIDSDSDNCGITGGGSGGGGGPNCTSSQDYIEISYDGGNTWTQEQVTVVTCE